MLSNASQNNHNLKENNSRTKSQFFFLKLSESPQGRIPKGKTRKGQLNPNKTSMHAKNQIRTQRCGSKPKTFFQAITLPEAHQYFITATLDL